jgi:hypothetical protein
MKTTLKRLIFRVTYLILAIYAYFGGRCPAQGCPACKLVGK